MADKRTRPAGSTSSSREELATLLDGTGLFGEFTHEENKTVAHYVMSIQAPEGATVFREGERIAVDLATGEIRDEGAEKRFFSKPIPDFMREIIRAGGLVEYVKGKSLFHASAS